MSAKWTVMVYVAGYNNLSPFASKDLDEMRKVGSSDDGEGRGVRQAARAAGRAPHRSSARTARTRSRENLGDEVDSGSPQTMLDFIRWAKEKAPAERYALVIWNHGSGWDPLDFDELYSEVRAARASTPRELAERSRDADRPQPLPATRRDRAVAGDALQRAIASDDGSGHSLDTIELGQVLKKAHEDARRARSSCSAWTRA